MSIPGTRQRCTPGSAKTRRPSTSTRLLPADVPFDDDHPLQGDRYTIGADKAVHNVADTGTTNQKAMPIKLSTFTMPTV